MCKCQETPLCLPGRVEFLASGQQELLTCSWHPLSQLKGKQRCLDARAPQLLVAGDTSALPQGRNPAATLLTPHGQAALQPPHLAPQSKSPLALGTGWHMLPSETSKSLYE